MNNEYQQIIKDILKNDCDYYDSSYYYFKINSNEILLINISAEITYHICSIVKCENAINEHYPADTAYSSSQITFAKSLSRALNIDYTLNHYYYNSYLKTDQVFEFLPEKLKEFYIFNMDLF